MRGKGKIIACELHKERIKRLDDTIRLSGASSILNGFLILRPQFASFFFYISSLSTLPWYMLKNLTWLLDVESLLGDFLKLDPKDPSYSKVWCLCHIYMIYGVLRLSCGY